MLTVAIAVGIGLAGAAVLAIMYTGASFRWPSEYSRLSNTFALPVGSRLYRTLLFRALPVFVIAVSCWSASVDLGGDGVIAAVIPGMVHGLGTNGREILSSLRLKGRTASVNYAGYHLGVLALLAGVTGIACLAAPWARVLVPRPSELLNALWTGAFVALAGAYLLKASAKRDDDPEQDGRYLVNRGVPDIGVDALDFLFSEASRLSADPLVMKSLAVCEALQRPKWFRRLERIVGSVLRRQGTYGVMQVLSPHPITDEDSITRAANSMTDFMEWSTYAMEGYPDIVTIDHNFIWDAAGRHNGDYAFIQQAQAVYYHLFEQITWLDGNDTGVVELRRFPTTWGVRIISRAPWIRISDPASVFVLRTRPEGRRYWSFEHHVPIRTRFLVMSDRIGQDKQVVLNVAADSKRTGAPY